MKHLTLIIRGKVQGVFFRASTKEKAQALGITGTVRNQPDGCVLVEAEGSEEQLEQFVQWCHRGPAHARVDEVIINEGEPQKFAGFKVIH